MKVTYIGHSGFLSEWEDCTWLFDYYEGALPPIRPEKPLFVFSSHAHEDHFNPEILSISGPSEIYYIFSDDIRHKMKKWAEPAHVYYVKPEQTLQLPIKNSEKVLHLQTLRSTDCGVAFLLQYEGKYVYHAGDLHWWVWKGESKAYNHNMTANFKKYIQPLHGLDLFAAFVPLDPRQEEWYDKGILYVLENAQITYVFPMHFGKDFSIVQKFTASEQGRKYKEQIAVITQPGQSFLCT